MADVDHIISLGIGSPAAILQFLTFGLGVGVTVSTKADVTVTDAALYSAAVTDAAVYNVTVTDATRA